jgi:hypothetical protein
LIVSIYYFVRLEYLTLVLPKYSQQQFVEVAVKVLPRISENLTRYIDSGPLFLPNYSQQQFVEVAVKVLPRISENLARYIGFTVYSNDGDIRDVLSVGKLIRKSEDPPEVENMIRTLLKYGEGEGEKNDH